MTGICFHALGDRLGTERVAEIATETAEISARYSATLLWSGDTFECYDISYESYPTAVFDVGSSTVILEGYVHDAGDLAECAAFVDDHVADGHIDAALADWLGDRDGEFVFYHISPGEHVTVVSDALGRLPLCHATVPGLSVGGRSIDFVKRCLEAAGSNLTVDRPALAQTLLLNYALDSHTLVAEIAKTGPATVLSVAPEETSRDTYRELSLDEPANQDRSLPEHATAVAERLREVCRRRSDLDGTHLVSLSGGLDSRTVAATLDAVGADFAAVSFTRPAKKTRKDVSVALEVAQELGVEYTIFPVRNTAGGMVELLRRTGGLNYLAMGFLVDYYRQITTRYPEPIQHYTGDFGALLKGSWRVDESLGSLSAAVDWVIDHEAAMPVETAAELAGTGPAELRSFVADRLSSFPEERLADRVSHFLLRERGFNWNFRAEDRNRSFVWNHAPLNARPIVDYLLTVPRSVTADYELYRAVLEDLDPAMAALPYAPYGAPLGSVEHRVKKRAYELIPNQSRLQRAVQRFVLDREGFPAVVADCLADQMANGAAVDECVDPAAVSDFIANRPEQSRKAAFDLLTVTSMVEYIRGDPLTLETYHHREF